MKDLDEQDTMCATGEIWVSSLATGCDRPGGKHKQLCQASGGGSDEVA